MDQQATQNQNISEHSGDNDEKFIHWAKGTRGSASRPLFPTSTLREEQPHATPVVSFGDEARQAYLEYTTLPPNMKEICAFDQFMK